MGKYKGHIELIEDLVKKIKIRENEFTVDINSDNALFMLKLHQQDMIALHNEAINKIEMVLNLKKQDETEMTRKSSKSDYRNKNFWRSQITFTINGINRAMKSTEILEMYPIHPGERRQCMSILSNVLSELCDLGVIKKFKVEGEKGYYYALPEMILKKAD